MQKKHRLKDKVMEKSKVYELKAPGREWMVLLEACYCKVTGAEAVGTSQRGEKSIRAELREEEYEDVRLMFELAKKTVLKSHRELKSRLIEAAAERARGDRR